MEQEFTNNWFNSLGTPENWKQILNKTKPQRVLEIGSYEGASSCFLIKTLSPLVDSLELHCVDTWEGGVEHQEGGACEANMSEVEARFHRNLEIERSRSDCPVELTCHKGMSDVELAKLLAEGKGGYFDFVYVDGSHQAPDVLIDAVLAFKLTRVGGVIVFDDYLWYEAGQYTLQDRDPLRCVKPAVDAFTNIFFRKVTPWSAPLGQIYLSKTSD